MFVSVWCIHLYLCVVSMNDYIISRNVCNIRFQMFFVEGQSTNNFRKD